MKELITKVEDMIQLTIELGGSRYTTFLDSNEVLWTIRVSDHNCNPSRLDSNTISFVIPCNESYIEVVKKFKSVPCQYILNNKGEFWEEFYDVAECLNHNID